MFHSFSAAKTFGEKEEKSIKKCYLHFISLLLFLFLDAFSNLVAGGGGHLQEGFVGSCSDSSVSLPHQ